MNQVLENKAELSKRGHYVVKGQHGSYWFQLYAQKLSEMVRAAGSSLHLIVYGSETERDDYYITPFEAVSKIYVPDNLARPSKGNATPRWPGKIINGKLKLDGSHAETDVSVFKGDQGLLDAILKR